MISAFLLFPPPKRSVNLVSMWTYVLGPLCALLPRRWRQKVFSTSEHSLRRVAMLSGVLEFIVAMAVLRAWYWRFFTILGQKYTHQVLSMKYTLIAPSDRLGAAGFIVLATTPVTWLILYFVGEGLFRIFVAMGTGEACGLLPLVIIDYISRPLFRPAKRQLPLVPDEVVAQGDHGLTISSCRLKPEWKHPYAIRYRRAFFRVVGQKTQTFGPRPYVYTLRRLGPGEVASGLRDYDPADILSTPYQVDRLL